MLVNVGRSTSKSARNTHERRTEESDGIYRGESLILRRNYQTSMARQGRRVKLGSFYPEAPFPAETLGFLFVG